METLRISSFAASTNEILTRDQLRNIVGGKLLAYCSLRCGKCPSPNEDKYYYVAIENCTKCVTDAAEKSVSCTDPVVGPVRCSDADVDGQCQDSGSGSGSDSGSGSGGSGSGSGSGV